jgi:predicted AAA+ superfamily ATPase
LKCCFNMPRYFKMIFNRKINVPKTLNNSFFQWGPRQAGKTYFLRNTFPWELIYPS